MFVITKAMQQRMIDHALDGFPNEVCGLLGGRDNRAWDLRAMQNVAETPRVRYSLDPAEQVAVFDAFEARGWELVAIYHSHPAGPSHPSATDIAESYYPGAVYFIVSLADRLSPEVTAWQIQDGRAQPVEWQAVP